MDRNALDTLAELTALKYVLEHVGKIAVLAAGMRPEHAAQMRTNAKEMLQSETFPSVDPALSDHFADEIAHRVDRVLSGIEEKVMAAYQEMRPKT